jgi:Domain of unknown function (DUF4386)
MTDSGIDDRSTQRTQRIYARMAGFLFLWLIITGLGGALTTSHIAGSGTFAVRAQRIVASEHLYRTAVASELVETLSALLLAFALYATLLPVNKLLAQFALYWRMAESLIGCVGIVFEYARLGVYTSAAPGSANESQALVRLTDYAGHATYNLAALCFSLGSILFYYLFFKSSYIPRILSSFGVFASVVVTVICFGSLIFPEYAGRLQYGWAPMAIAEVVTGIWLMLFAIKTQGHRGKQPIPQEAAV